MQVQQPDRLWFKKHITRAHRIRKPWVEEVGELICRAFPGEYSMEGLAAALEGTIELFVVVRQAAPYSPRRLLSVWARGTHLPDDEDFAHALFDVTWDAQQQADILINVNRQSIDELAYSYRTATRQ